MTDILYIWLSTLQRKYFIFQQNQHAKKTNNCSTFRNTSIHSYVLIIYKGIFTHMQLALCYLNLLRIWAMYCIIEAQNASLWCYEWLYVKYLHLITHQLNQLSIVHIFYHIQNTGELPWPPRSAYGSESSLVKWSNRPGHQRSNGVHRLGKCSATFSSLPIPSYHLSIA